MHQRKLQKQQSPMEAIATGEHYRKNLPFVLIEGFFLPFDFHRFALLLSTYSRFGESVPFLMDRVVIFWVVNVLLQNPCCITLSEKNERKVLVTSGTRSVSLVFFVPFDPLRRV
jgi:hypothetical protein